MTPAPDDRSPAFEAETARLLRARLPYALAFYLVAVVAMLVLEARHHPARLALLATRDAVDMLVCVTAILAMRRRLPPPWPVAIASGLVAWALLANAAYSASVGGSMERFVMLQVVILDLVVVLFPWGWRAQLVPVAGSLLGFAAAGPFMHASDATAFCAVALGITGAATVLGARFVHRYRLEGFLAHAREREEAEIAAALYDAATVLAPVESGTDVLDGVTHIAVGALGCDWSCALRWDAQAQGFRLASEVGLSPATVSEVRRLEFGMDFSPAVASIRAGHVTEIPDASVSAIAPAALLTRWEMASLLAVPMRRGTEVAGLLVSGFHTRRGPFGARYRRVQTGLAQLAAVALENVGLVADLRAANRFKSEFVSTMSHELRTPLNVILGFAEMARDGDVGLAERERCLVRVEEAARDLFSLIEDTLEIGRIEAGHDGVRLTHVALRTLLADLRAVCERLPRAQAVPLRWRSDVPDVSVLTDARKLTVVVRNLVGNACKFTEQGQVAVWVTVTEGQLVLTVSDTGIGIAAADRDGIFEMFRQGDGSDSRRHGGLGLGLHITRRYVEQLGGTIDVASEPGRGSVFSVKLPLTTVAPRADAA